MWKPGFTGHLRAVLTAQRQRCRRNAMGRPLTLHSKVAAFESYLLIHTWNVIPQRRLLPWSSTARQPHASLHPSCSSLGTSALKGSILSIWLSPHAGAANVRSPTASTAKSRTATGQTVTGSSILSRALHPCIQHQPPAWVSVQPLPCPSCTHLLPTYVLLPFSFIPILVFLCPEWPLLPQLPFTIFFSIHNF